MKHHSKERNPGILDSLKGLATGKNALLVIAVLGVGAYLWGRKRGRSEGQAQARVLARRMAQARPPQQQAPQGIPMMGMGSFENLGDLADMGCGDKPCSACAAKTSAPAMNEEQVAMSGLSDDLAYYQ